MLRLVGVLGTIVAFGAAESAPAARAAEARPLTVRATDARLSVLAGNPQGTHQPFVFVTLPITKGFADFDVPCFRAPRMTSAAVSRSS